MSKNGLPQAVLSCPRVKENLKEMKIKKLNYLEDMEERKDSK